MDSSNEDQPTQCTLLGGPFELSVQFFLAMTAIAALVYKRNLERPPNRRSWLIWGLDCSKQAYASALQHATNMILGVLFAKSGGASECAWYLTSFTITVLCGVVILAVIMNVYNKCVERYDCTLLRTGEYGTPPSWKPWLAQSLIWGFLASGEKLITSFFVILPLRQVLDSVAAYLEAPLLSYPRVELVLVMVVGPMLLNTLFFWVVDSIIMHKRGGGGAPHQEIGEAIIAGKSGSATCSTNGTSNQEYCFMNENPSSEELGNNGRPGLPNVV